MNCIAQGSQFSDSLVVGRSTVLVENNSRFWVVHSESEKVAL
jgi:hypothetical protein